VLQVIDDASSLPLRQQEAGSDRKNRSGIPRKSMTFAELRSARIFYEDQGEGKAVIFVSGGGLDSSYWKPVLGYISAHYRCITFDNRGVGKSDKPPGAYTIEVFAEDVIEIAASLQLDSYYLVGHSMGGYIGQIVAGRDRKCASLVLLGTAPRPPAETIYLMELRKKLRRQLDSQLFRATGASWMFGPETSAKTAR
jgi:aminoacrylate hydrolase